jgi:DNA invertase Pin-like site-specific DNA recombinase
MERHYRQKIDRLERKRIDSVSVAEGRRIDALLAADRANVSLANARAELTASNLAERVDTTAKAAATQTEASAAALRGTTEATAQTLGQRITPLEQARYETAAIKVEKHETKIQSNWTTNQIILAIAAGAGVMDLLIRSGIIH